MLSLIKKGLYTDTCVLFNNDTFNLHSNYLKLVSSYFTQHINNTHTITYLDINNELLDSKIFIETINMLYDGKFDFSTYNIFDLIEIYRLWTYFGFKFIDFDNESCLNLIKKKICKYADKYNNLMNGLSCKKFKLTYDKRKNILILYNNDNNTNIIFYLSEIMVNELDNNPDYKYVINSPKLTKKIYFNSNGKIFLDINNEQITFDANIDIDYLLKQKKINDKKYTVEQSYFLLNLFIDNNCCDCTKIISQMEISVENISRYPKKFHKLICKEFSNREDDNLI